MTPHVRKIIFGFLGILLLATLVSGVVLYQYAHMRETRVSFLDIGQGDAILISEGTHQILIDGGPDGRGLLEQLGRLMPFWDRTIDVVIATHPDSDHIDGLVDVFGAYDVSYFITPTIEKDTNVARALRDAVAASEETHSVPAQRGERVAFPSGATLRVIYPFGPQQTAHIDDANTASVTALFSVAGETFFLGGDLPSEAEDLLSLHENITVLKAGHHGSKTSTSTAFLRETSPRDVIISAGANNRYGHPAPEVVKRVLKSGARIFRTDHDGTIIYTCTDTCDISFD